MGENSISALRGEQKEELESLNRELEKKILEANEDKTLVKWSKLLPELMTSDILVAGQYGDPNGGGNMALLMMRTREGKEIVPFFTNIERVSAQLKTGSFDIVKINTARFFSSIKGKAALLNPSTDYMRLFNPFDVKVLALEYIDKAPPLDDILNGE